MVSSAIRFHIMNVGSEKSKKKGRAQSIDLYVGERLKEIRKMHKITQENLAEKVGVSFQQIQKYENGKNRISVGRLHEFSKLLKTPFDSFFEGYTSEKTNPSLYAGMADNKQASISDHPANKTELPVSKKEIADLIQVYYALDNPKLRKSFLNLGKNMVENIKDQDS